MANTLDPARIQPRLAGWLAARVGGLVRIEGLEVPSSSGMSNTTALFDATWTSNGVEERHELVARIHPVGSGVFLTYDLPREYRVMEILGASTAIPVPAVRWYETDPAVLGASFMIMERVHGRTAADDPPFTVVGWLADLTPRQRATVHDNALRRLVEIHQLDWKGLGLDFLDRPHLGGTGVEQVLTHYERTYAWAAGDRRFPTVEAALAWARDNLPTGEPTVLCHGDARLANFVIADDLSVEAVLDWELSTLGSPGLDLGWWLFVMRHYTEGIGVPLPDGYPTPEQTIARYTELSGRPLPNMHFYEVFGAIFLAVTMIQVANVLTDAGLLPRESTMAESNPASQLLASMLGLPAPIAGSSTFIGQR